MHAVVSDVVWVRAADGTLRVIDLPGPSNDDVAELIWSRVLHPQVVVGGR
jgi:hypothetical protein